MAVGHQVVSPDLYPLFSGSDLPVFKSNFLDQVSGAGSDAELVERGVLEEATSRAVSKRTFPGDRPRLGISRSGTRHSDVFFQRENE